MFCFCFPSPKLKFKHRAVINEPLIANSIKQVIKVHNHSVQCIREVVVINTWIRGSMIMQQVGEAIFGRGILLVEATGIFSLAFVACPLGK